MKKGIIIVVAFLGFALNNATAQTKFGYVNAVEILYLMPEIKKVQAALDSFQMELTDEYNVMLKDYEKLIKERDKLVKDGASETMITYKEEEIGNKQQLIQKFQGIIEEQIAEKQQKLLTPLSDKITNAINEVAKEKGLHYVFDLSQNTILYKEPTDDISKDVRKKLGIAEDAKLPSNGGK